MVTKTKLSYQLNAYDGVALLYRTKHMQQSFILAVGESSILRSFECALLFFYSYEVNCLLVSTRAFS